MIRSCVCTLTIAVAALAQPGATLPTGVPLRVTLEHRVRIQHAGEPVQARLAEPVYVFDRAVLPAGTLVEGHIAEIGGVPARRRVAAILNGNFTPSRQVSAQFDSLVLGDGSRLSLHTVPSQGTAHPVRIAGPRGQQEEHGPFTPPGKMSRLKSTLFGTLPYHRQSWRAGTLFTSVLQEPLSLVPPAPAATSTASPAAAPLEAPQVHARLLTAIGSATAHRGAPVEAVVTRPLFSTDHRLLVPEGSRLIGDVVEARPARWLHRNGRLLFAFRQIQLPSGIARPVEGYLEGVDTDFDAHLALDAEGGARVASPKTRFIFPAIAVAVGALSFHQDYNAQGVPDQDIAGRAESGAVGLGLVGTLLAQASRNLASGIAFAGAGFSVYSTFLARGENVVLPANTQVKVSLRTRGDETGATAGHRAPR